MTFTHVLRRSSTCLSHLKPRYASNAAPSASKKASVNQPKDSAQGTPLRVSSCVADTVMPGLNYLKNQPQVLALPDEQYPEWLWTILQPKQYADDGPGGIAERKKRRAENKQGIKDRNFMQTQ